MTPEAKARVIIDKMLIESGYILQDMKDFNRSAGFGVAVREYPTQSGPVDYLLFVDGNPIGVVEAKAANKGENLGSVAEQSKRYAESGLKHTKEMPNIRFAYESNGIITNFCDYYDEKFRSRELFSFHRPETLYELLKYSNTLRNRMKTFPNFSKHGFRECQVTAILNLEKSFAKNKPRALIQMATGAGKTYTAITSVYRLLKHTKAKRILFLVDTKNLGEQAEGEFLNYKPYDDSRLFPELYPVRRLNSSYIPTDTKVCISTIQRMYSILRGEEMDDSLEQTSMNEQQIATTTPRDVVYNSKYPPEFFDIIIIDECHRSIYNIWQQVFDYFDAFCIGLTATPDSRTFAFFNQNIVSEYTHEQAVLDGVNVGRNGTYLIETEIGSKGGLILKQTVEKRDRLSRKKRWEQLDEDLTYTPTQLDRDVVNLTQIRGIVKEFKKKLPEMFPYRTEVPKTLIFAKTDSHADDIMKIVREEFGEGNEFCKKITYTVDDSKSVLTSFRNDFNPRVAVTVDMIATGTDVKPIECLIFMRDVRSKNYFEQMLGRATRVLEYEDLHRVSPSATQKKLGYIVVDAVGVTKSHKTTSRQLERKPTVSLKDLMMSVAMGAHDVDTLTTLANRLIKLDTVMTLVEKEKFKTLCRDEKISLSDKVPCSKGEISVIAIAETLLNAFDEDIIEEVAQKRPDVADVCEWMAIAASTPFNNPKLRDYLENVRKNHDQIIDNVNIDEVTFSGWDSEHTDKAEEAISTFTRFIEENKDSIEALQIIYSQSYRIRPLTLRMIEELYEVLQKAPYHLTNEKLWLAYSITQNRVKQKNVINKLVDIVSLIRFQLGQTKELYIFSDEVDLRFRDWIFAKNAGHKQFTEEQTEWLRMVRDHIATSISITADDLDYTPFDASGGRGKFYQLFGNEFEDILNEMNIALLAA
jgi:type I restriction enzyme R subunit